MDWEDVDENDVISSAELNVNDGSIEITLQPAKNDNKHPRIEIQSAYPGVDLRSVYEPWLAPSPPPGVESGSSVKYAYVLPEARPTWDSRINKDQDPQTRAAFPEWGGFITSMNGAYLGTDVNNGTTYVLESRLQLQTESSNVHPGDFRAMSVLYGYVILQALRMVQQALPEGFDPEEHRDFIRQFVWEYGFPHGEKDGAPVRFNVLRDFVFGAVVPVMAACIFLAHPLDGLEPFDGTTRAALPKLDPCKAWWVGGIILENVKDALQWAFRNLLSYYSQQICTKKEQIPLPIAKFCRNRLDMAIITDNIRLEARAGTMHDENDHNTIRADWIYQYCRPPIQKDDPVYRACLARSQELDLSINRAPLPAQTDVLMERAMASLSLSIELRDCRNSILNVDTEWIDVWRWDAFYCQKDMETVRVAGSESCDEHLCNVVEDPVVRSESWDEHLCNVFEDPVWQDTSRPECLPFSFEYVRWRLGLHFTSEEGSRAPRYPDVLQHYKTRFNPPSADRDDDK